MRLSFLKKKKKEGKKEKITMPLIRFNEKDRETIVTGAIGQRTLEEDRRTR